MEDTARSWQLYFKDDTFSLDDRRVTLISSLCSFFLRPEGWVFLSRVRYVLRQHLVLYIDLKALQQQSNISDLDAAIELQPHECLGCLGAAVYECLFESEHYTAQLTALLGLLPPANYVHVRPYNVKSLHVGIRNVLSGEVGKVVAVKGTVIRLSPLRAVAVSIEYKCGKCGNIITVDCPDGRPVAPTRCSDGCKSKSFQPQLNTMKTVDWQKVRIQELLSDAEKQEGGPPRTIEVELMRDLVHSVTCGDEVSVIGFVRVMKGEQMTRTQSGIVMLYVDAISVENHNRGGADAGTQITGDRKTQFSPTDLKFIVTFQTSCAPNQLLYLCHSLSPTILGHSAVKLGLILSLLGASSPPAPAVAPRGPTLGPFAQPAARVTGACMPPRSNIHVLLIGEPGLGKSQLLHAAAAASPRGVYVCSKTSTGAGLTVSVSRDCVTNEAAFEAGALVLADGGVCCLDELDNMKGEHKMLLEVMEQQEVCVAKGGLTAQMPARTAVIAACNPAGGAYCRARSMQENAKMSAALFSRFDLTFAMLDDADAEADRQLSEHVLRAHCAGGRPKPKARKVAAPAAVAAEAGESTLLQRLAAFECEDPLPLQLLQRFIAYAREHCHPELTHGAKLVLKEFYLELRKHSAIYRSTCITTRQLESMVRLTQARARAELRTEATADDARDVVALMCACMRDLLRGGGAAARRGGGGGRGGAKAEAQRFMDALQRLKRAEGRAVFSREELEAVAVEIGVRAVPVGDLIAKLNDAGELLKKGAAEYKVA